MASEKKGQISGVTVPGLRSLRSRGRERSLDDLNLMEGSDAKTNIEGKIENLFEAEEDRLSHTTKGSVLQELLDISPILSDGAAAIVDDSFLRCFTSMEPDPWNWNFYLFPMWWMGAIVRFLILFPIRVVILMGGFLIFFTLFFSVRAIMKDGPKRREIERGLVKFQCSMFVASWTGVVKFHGPRPVKKANRVWVANHTSMIDYIILCSYSPFAVIMQLHAGWVGFLQTSVLSCLGCLWFNRTEVKDRKIVAEKMSSHISSGESTPLLIFPEGTCVNNEYCVMFKKGTFELGAVVCPIAIKYNKIFVDAFWNSRRQSFTAHLLKMMTSWAVVCDVYFLEPQSLQAGETPQEFSSRVQKIIADQARLRIVPWDGYLKYYNLGEKHPQLIEKRRRVFAHSVRRHLMEVNEAPQSDHAVDVETSSSLKQRRSQASIPE
ncbi:hypothetical protein BSKO_00450 [Bryopsis sp. KO-2023]|nr:hypothetical protein BSKO_00450 [Bryopsis sp. KO-2023]